MKVTVVVAVVLLAAAGAKSKKAAAPAPTPVSVDPAAARAAAQALRVSADLATRVEKYANNANTVSHGGTDGALCSLVEEAASLAADLSGQAAGKPDAAIAALEKAAPGLRVAGGGASYDGLARLAGARHSTSSALLAGASGMLDSKRPGFIVMKTEERGCTDYSKSIDSVTLIVKGWKVAPACLKERLRIPLGTALADDELPTCYCTDQDSTSFATKHYAAQLSTLKDFDGAGHSKAILAEVDDSSAHFTCNAR